MTRVRHCLAQAIHRFFHEEGFLGLRPRSSPPLTPKAGEMFLRLHPGHGKPAAHRRRQGGLQRRFLWQRGFPDRMGQLNAETYACALSKVYTFGPTFRAENSNTSRHLAEFWMVEPEVALLRFRPPTPHWPKPC
ncbi:amino acid--tRNA ligase-related protein [Escherichia coli]